MAINFVQDSFHTEPTGPGYASLCQKMQIGSGALTGPVGHLRHVRLSMLQYVRDAVANQGLRALENPRSSAIVHEAGHAVVYTSFGFKVRSCKIERESDSYDQWGGFTDGGSAWRSDHQSAPVADLKQACCLMAGVAAERLFDPLNYRQASSADEVVRAHCLASTVAHKLGCDHDAVVARVDQRTDEMLLRNKDIVLKIAQQLDQKMIVRGNRLAKLLVGVARTDADSLCAGLEFPAETPTLA
ncbi:MAG: hypothetical protein K2Z80_25685 [Xanthobacteraceae bacterium]|nr:hypothetical protein [Xanthobacteraceae bacterium]